MFRHWLAKSGLLALAAGALLFAVGPVLAQHGGGHGGGGHGGGGHGGGGGAHWGGSGAHWGGGGAHYYGGRSYYGGYNRGYGYGLGYYPGYYGSYYPGYSGYSYPSYYENNYYYDNYPQDYAAAPATSSYQSFYPSTAVENSAAAPPLPHTVAMFTVKVPANATVWIDGQQMSETGTRRVFETPVLDPDKKYSYDVRATWTENGREVARTRHVEFHPGDRITVDLMSPSAAP